MSPTENWQWRICDPTRGRQISLAVKWKQLIYLLHQQLVSKMSKMKFNYKYMNRTGKWLINLFKFFAKNSGYISSYSVNRLLLEKLSLSLERTTLRQYDSHMSLHKISRNKKTTCQFFLLVQKSESEKTGPMRTCPCPSIHAGGEWRLWIVENQSHPWVKTVLLTFLCTLLLPRSTF